MPEKVLISVIINNESKFAKKISKEETLPQIRKIFGEKLPNDSVFTLPDGSEIDKEDESDYTLSEILKDDKVYMKSNESLKTSLPPVTIPEKKKINQFQEVN